MVSPSPAARLDVRVPRDDELDGWFATETAAFLGHPAGQRELEAPILPVDRMLGAWDLDPATAPRAAPAPVGVCASYPFRMTLPGGVSVAVGGVSAVGVSGTHRRRGVLRALMAAQLDDLAARGEVAAVLNASEASIYGRFGYGMASRYQSMKVVTARSAFAPHLGTPTGSLELVPRQAAHAVLAEVWDRYAPHTVGEVARPAAWWDVVLGDLAVWKGGGDQFVVVHRDATGRPDGYARYTARGAPLPDRASVKVEEFVAVDDDVRRALWRYLLDIDLVGTVEVVAAPVDEPLVWWLADPREAQVTRVSDYLWVCPLDLGAYLSARTFGGDDGVVVATHDAFRPHHDGCWRIDPDGCRRTDDAPDLEAPLATLGSLSLGGVSATHLARSGRITERTPGALAVADRLFATECAPFCTTRF